jgi:hypothetical protein
MNSFEQRYIQLCSYNNNNNNNNIVSNSVRETTTPSANLYTILTASR